MVGFSASGNDVRMGTPILLTNSLSNLMRVTDETFICQTVNTSTYAYTIYSCVLNDDGSISFETKSNSGNYAEYANSFYFVTKILREQISPTTVTSEDTVVLLTPGYTGSFDGGSRRSYIASLILLKGEAQH